MLVLVACTDSDKSETSPTTPPSANSPTTTVPFGTTPISTPEASAQGQLIKVAVGDHDGFVRVVFTFSNAVPGYSVKSATPPFVQDGSGKTVTVPGNAFLAVRLIARAHDEDGKSTAPSAIAHSSNGALREVRLLGDFEGVVNYVVGLGNAGGFRTFTLAFPSRLVLDIAT